MAKVDVFRDNKKACWSEVLTKNGERIFISVAGTDILIKKKGIVFNGRTLFSSDINKTSKVIIQLRKMFDEEFVPNEMTNPALRAFSNVAVLSEGADDLKQLLNSILD